MTECSTFFGGGSRGFSTKRVPYMDFVVLPNALKKKRERENCARCGSLHL